MAAVKTHAQLFAQLQATGAGWLDDTEAARHVNEAASALAGDELWPWQAENVLAATVPYTLLQPLVALDYVRDTTTRRSIQPRRRSELVDAGEDLTLSGAPLAYYLEAAGGTLGRMKLLTSPLASGTIDIRYFTSAPWWDATGATRKETGATTDILCCGGEWQDIVILLAQLSARAEKGMDSAVLNARLQLRMEQMRQRLETNWDEADVVLPAVGTRSW